VEELSDVSVLCDDVDDEKLFMALFDIPAIPPMLLIPLLPFPLCCCVECEEEIWGR